VARRRPSGTGFAFLAGPRAWYGNCVTGSVLTHLQRSCTWLVVALAAGCAIDHTADPPVDYFVADHVLEIELTLDPADWDALRRQNRDFFTTLGGADCLAEPFGSPFTYFEATVTVDGETRERVGVRKKGFLGSLDDEKPSLKIDMDEFVVGQDLFGTERITLNNARQDPSYVNQCMGYQIFARAGVPAPRCNFAHVTVNGNDLGIYVHVENVKKRFLREHFADDEGSLYEGTLSDFRAGWTDTFEQKTNREVPSDRSDIAAVVDALAPGAPPDALGAVIDLSDFTNFWATEILIGHWDGYASNTNNFFIYGDPTDGRFHFVPWGIDNVLTDGGLDPTEGTPPVRTTGVLADHLWRTAEGRAAYEARMRELLDTVWDGPELVAEIDRMAALIRPYLQPRDLERGFDEAVSLRRAFVEARRERLLAALDGTYVSPPLRDPFCFVPIGDVSGTFQTTYGSSASPDPFSGRHPATVDVTVEGAPISFTNLGSLSGPDEDDPARAVVGVLGLRPDGWVTIVAFTVAREVLRPGSTVPIDFRSAAGFVIEFDPSVMDAEPNVIGLVANGTVSFVEAGGRDGDAIVGSFEGQLFESFF
jgi:spore coat protein CotH